MFETDTVPLPEPDRMAIEREHDNVHSMHSNPRHSPAASQEGMPLSPVHSVHRSDPDEPEPRPVSPAGSDAAFGSPAALVVLYADNENNEMYSKRYNGADDPPYIRLAYLNSLVSSVVFQNSTESVDMSLRGNMDCLRLAGSLPEDLHPLTTLNAVRDRLGLDTDDFMLRQPICSICFKPYSFDELQDLPEARCSFVSGRTRCKGMIWREKLKNNVTVRRPVRCICYMRVIPALRRMFLRPSFICALENGKKAHATHTDGILHNVCCGVAMNSARIGRRRVFCADGSVRDEAETADSEKVITRLDCGLLFAINLDWFRTTAKGVESTGAIYLTIQNLDRSVHFLPANVILACVIPGPKEPPLEQLNWVLDPIVKQLEVLYAGVLMRVHNRDHLVLVHGGLLMSNNDTPARSKGQGTAGHAHDAQFCMCTTKQADINTIAGYDIENFESVDEYLLLQMAYKSNEARTKKAQQDIHKKYGIRWSVLNRLPDWKPHSSAPIDIMHNLFLGLVEDCWKDILVSGHYFTASQKRNFDGLLDQFEWPSHIGRLPKKICERGGVRKADEWRRLVSVLPIMLWAVWRDPKTDALPLEGPPIHELVTDRPRFQRSCSRLYDLILLLTVACRIFASWSIRLADVERAQRYLQLYCQGILQMGVNLKPNHHFSMHYEEFFANYGPAYAWWLFAYERFNGLLEKVKINNKLEDTSTSLMRFWVRLHRLYEMVENLPDDVCNEEKLAISRLCFNQQTRGTLLSQAAQFSGDADPIRTSRYPRNVNLRDLGSNVYLAALKYAQTVWPHLNLKHEQTIQPGGMLFLASRVAELLDFIYKSGVRYGSTSSRRTHADRYILARIDGSLVACRIEYHFRLTVGNEAPCLAVAVRRFVISDPQPPMAWDLYVEDLGYYVGLADELGPFEFISTDQIFSPVGLATVSTCTGTRLWVAVSYDRTGDERSDDAGLFEEDEQ